MLATAVPPLATAGDPPPAAGGAAACTTCGGGAGLAAGDDALLLAALAVLPWLPTELAAPLAAPGLTLALGAPPASLIPDADADPQRRALGAVRGCGCVQRGLAGHPCGRPWLPRIAMT